MRIGGLPSILSPDMSIEVQPSKDSGTSDRRQKRGTGADARAGGGCFAPDANQALLPAAVVAQSSSTCERRTPMLEEAAHQTSCLDTAVSDS